MAEGVAVTEGELICTVTIDNAQINVWQNNITNQTADAIVCSTNRSLNLGAGISGHIADAAGRRELQEAMRAFPGDSGVVDVGSAFTTSSFRMTTCNHIIHAVPPTFSDTHGFAEQALRETVRSVMHETQCHRFRSVAMIALGCGTNQNPPQRSLPVICEEMVRALREKKVKEIHFVEYDCGKLKIVRDVLRMYAGFEDHNEPSTLRINQASASYRPANSTAN